jgi:hypothetical protein
MRTKSLITLLAVFCQLAAIAQNDTIEPPDTIARKYRNEVGAIVTPIALVMFGGESNAQPIAGLSYKRVFGQWAFRANFSYKSYPAWYYSQNEQAFAIDTLYRTKKSVTSKTAYIGRLGMEYRMRFGGRFYFVGGADLHGQRVEFRDELVQTNYKIESVTNRGTARESMNLSVQSTQKLYEYHQKGMQMGLGFSAGLMVSFGRHWWLLGQMRADYFTGPANFKMIDHLAKTRSEGLGWSSDFEAGVPLSELWLFYRF